jgi:hypothetical protein
LRADGSGAVEGVPDGVVDGLDYDFWKARFGNVIGGGAGGGEQGVAELRIADFGLRNEGEAEQVQLRAEVDKERKIGLQGLDVVAQAAGLGEGIDFNRSPVRAGSRIVDGDVSRPFRAREAMWARYPGLRSTAADLRPGLSYVALSGRSRNEALVAWVAARDGNVQSASATADLRSETPRTTDRNSFAEEVNSPSAVEVVFAELVELPLP